MEPQCMECEMEIYVKNAYYYTSHAMASGSRMIDEDE